MKYDAIVIGAGPSGSIAARTLAEKGRRVLLLENGLFPGKLKACGGMVALDDFSEFNISRSVIEKEMAREIAVLPWGRKVISYPLVTVKRNVFDEHLAMAAKKSGADLKMHCKVVRARVSGIGNVEVTVDLRGSFEVFEAKTLIFADGVNTIAQSSAGIGFERKNSNVAFGVVYELDYPGNDLKDYYIFFNPDGLTKCGYAWIFPTRDSLNVGVYLPYSEFKEHRFNQDILRQYLKSYNTEFAEMIRGKKIISKLGAFIPIEAGKKLCSDSALVVGDAAGFVSSFSGAGIHNALYSGWLAGCIIEKSLQNNDFSRKTLSEYELRIRTSGFYNNLCKETPMFKLSNMAKNLHSYCYPKVFHIYKQRKEYSLLDNFKVVFYPWMGKLR